MLGPLVRLWIDFDQGVDRLHTRPLWNDREYAGRTASADFSALQDMSRDLTRFSHLLDTD